MLEQDKGRVSPTPEEVKLFFDRLFPDQGVGIKTFVHKDSGTRIQIDGHGHSEVAITLMNVFGEPKTQEVPMRPWNFPVEVSETFYIDLDPFTVKRHQIAWMDSLTGKRRDLFVQRDVRDANGLEPFDLSNDGPDHLSIGAISHPTRNQSAWTELFRLIRESTRAHPYSGAELPYWEETSIDSHMSSVNSGLDNVRKQLNHLGDEGVDRITIETDVDEEGVPHFSVSPSDRHNSDTSPGGMDY